LRIIVRVLARYGRNGRMKRVPSTAKIYFLLSIVCSDDACLLT